MWDISVAQQYMRANVRDLLVSAGADGSATRGVKTLGNNRTSRCKMRAAGCNVAKCNSRAV